MRKTIVFVEPLFYGINLLKVAKRLNYKVVVVISDVSNPQKNHYEGLYDECLIANTQDADIIESILNETGYLKEMDALIPAADYVTEVTAKVAKRLGVKGVDVFAAEAARDKGIAKKMYSKYGIPTADYAIVSDLEMAKNEAKRLGYPLVLKPQNACGSQNVFMINTENELIEKFEEIRMFKYSYMDYEIKNTYLMEEFIDGQEFSVEIFIDKKKLVFSEVTEKRLGDLPYFVEIMHVLPSSVLIEKKPEIINVAYRAVLALGFDAGVFHVEVKFGEKGAKIIEVNGRPGGDNITSDLLINARGVNLYEALIKWYLGEVYNFDKKINRASAIAYIMPTKEGIVREISNIDEIKRMEGVKKVGYDLELPCYVDLAHDSDGRIGYVIIEEGNSIKAKEKALAIVDAIELEYEEEGDSIA